MQISAVCAGLALRFHSAFPVSASSSLPAASCSYPSRTASCLSPPFVTLVRRTRLLLLHFEGLLSCGGEELAMFEVLTHCPLLSHLDDRLYEYEYTDSGALLLCF